jgi:hypothetical protein
MSSSLSSFSSSFSSTFSSTAAGAAPAAAGAEETAPPPEGTCRHLTQAIYDMSMVHTEASLAEPSAINCINVNNYPELAQM